MMKLENIVCSLELSKRLRELGIKQESLFYYHWYKKNREYEYIDCQIMTEKKDEFNDGKWDFKVYSAFTTSELGEMLPKGGWMQESTSEGFRVFIFDREPPHNPKEYTWSETEADARAKILIHLIENGIVKIEDL